MKNTSIRQGLATKGSLLGLVVMYESPGALERIGPDWDWVWIDGQHGQLDYRDCLNLVRTCDFIEKPALVRVPSHDYGAIGMALDTGAAGVIVPCVDTVEQARNLVNAAKFPPLGKRSYGGRRPIDLDGRNYVEIANESTLLVAQIETPEAISNVEAIAAVPGIDALFLGPDDLMWRRGYAMTVARSRETLGEDMETVVKACRDNGKLSVMVGVGEEMLSLCLEVGFDLIVSGGDVPFLANGSAAASKMARGVQEKFKGQHIGSNEKVLAPPDVNHIEVKSPY